MPRAYLMRQGGAVSAIDIASDPKQITWPGSVGNLYSLPMKKNNLYLIVQEQNVGKPDNEHAHSLGAPVQGDVILMRMVEGKLIDVDDGGPTTFLVSLLKTYAELGLVIPMGIKVMEST